MSLDIVSRNDWPHDPWERVEQNIALRAAIARLTDKQREALYLWMCGYTQEEIGERLGIARTTVEGRLHRAIERFREILR